MLLLAGVSGVMPFRAATADAVYDGRAVAWWIPVVALGVLTAAFAYVTGIAAGRRLGSRLASFVALIEVLTSVVFAWLLLGELPRAVQVAGGVLVLAGVVVVKLGEWSAIGRCRRSRPRTRPQRASCRLRKTSRCRSSRAAATGTARSAPTMPIRLPPTRAAITVTEPGMSTERCMMRGEMT